jgi:hypothetical protein
MFAPAGVDEKKVEALAEDMKKNGFTSVILLANLDGWYLVTGTHRYLAAKKLDKEDIEIDIKYVDVTDAIENYCEREDVTIERVPLDSLREVFEGTKYEEFARECVEW